MITISKSVLKDKMLEYFLRVERDGEELIITENSIPVIKVVPWTQHASVDQIFGDLRDKVEFHGDMTEPESEDWKEI